MSLLVGSPFTGERATLRADDGRRLADRLYAAYSDPDRWDELEGALTRQAGDIGFVLGFLSRWHQFDAQELAERDADRLNRAGLADHAAGGLLALAWVVLRLVVPTVERGAAILLAVSALAVVVPMLLATHWAAAVNLAGFEALPIPVMARTHGVANALGFTLLGLLGGRWALSRAPAPWPVTSPR